MRTFTLGSGNDRRFVVIEVDGATLGVVQGRADGSTKRADKALPSEAAARSAAELSARGYVERTNDGTVKPTRAVAPKPEKPDRSHLYDDLDEPEVAAGPALPRVAATIAEADPAADARLASVEFSPKDAAFKLKHPPGWQVETGARPDNTYSWGRFTGGSAKIQVFADVQGSLMSGSDSAQPQEKGSPLAPVQRAHEDYKRKAAEEYTDYRETEPALFEGSGLGEGRFSLFTASAGGLFGGKTRGLRVTLLTNDRRVTLLCECPGKEFDALRPTLLAVCRSVAR